MASPGLQINNDLRMHQQVREPLVCVMRLFWYGSDQQLETISLNSTEYSKPICQQVATP